MRRLRDPKIDGDLHSSMNTIKFDCIAMFYCHAIGRISLFGNLEDKKCVQ